LNLPSLGLAAAPDVTLARLWGQVLRRRAQDDDVGTVDLGQPFATI
jgi:hypothetical protein